MPKPKPLMVIDEKKAAELTKDPDIHILTHSKLGDQMAVRLPSKAQWRKFKADLTSDVPDKSEIANEVFVLDMLVFPERQAVAAYFEKRPAAVDVFSRGIAELVGFAGVAEKKD